MVRPPARKDPPRRIAGVDADEAAALSAASAAFLTLYPGTVNAAAVAEVVISAWIVERTRLHAGKRLTDNVAFNLGDAHLAGMLEAALPKIGGALALAGFPFDLPFTELTKAQAVRLFLAGVVAHREVAVAAGEAPDFPFDAPFNDAVPFGGPLSVEEAPF